MTNLHEDIILDLLPLYFANEASAASVALVDTYFAAHPQFAAAARAAQGRSIPIPPRLAENGGTVAIRRIQNLLRLRAALIAVAIFCSISPFSFTYDHGHLRYFMLRDATATALVYATVAAIAWIAVYALGRRTSAE
jgi:hypothetical protein